MRLGRAGREAPPREARKIFGFEPSYSPISLTKSRSSRPTLTDRSDPDGGTQAPKGCATNRQHVEPANTQMGYRMRHGHSMACRACVGNRTSKRNHNHKAACSMLLGSVQKARAHAPDEFVRLDRLNQHDRGDHVHATAAAGHFSLGEWQAYASVWSTTGKDLPARRAH